jgi:hypothetical protein
LQKLLKLNNKKFSDEVGLTTEIARTRIHMFRVVGLTFDFKTGFRDVG